MSASVAWVLIRPGLTQTARMLCGPPETARCCVRSITPDLAAPCTACPAKVVPRIPEIEPMFTSEPRTPLIGTKLASYRG
jgi:hypothetical protein